jgi:hypothetical protein
MYISILYGTIMWQNEALKPYMKIGTGNLTLVEMLNKDK